MNKIRKAELTRFFARLMLDQADALNGLMIFQGEKVLTRADMIELGREALTLIEEGTVR